jgi:endonuclease YncB( thermonuclease family)
MKFHISLNIRIIILFLLALCQNIYADEFGVVTKVIDGDTVYLLNHNYEKLKVRLQHIDAPELDQSYGKESKFLLEQLILNKKVTVIGDKKDIYKRLLGVISLDDVDINLEMIKAGAAWHFKKYAKFDQTEYQYQIYDENEHQAKLKKIGLWKENAISPWLWRKNKK